MRALWIVSVYVAGAVLLFVVLRTGAGQAERLGTKTAAIVAVGSMTALAAVFAFSWWLRWRAARADRHLPYGMTRRDRRSQ